MNIQVFSGRTTHIPGLGDVDIDKMNARRLESNICVAFRKRKARKKERGMPVVECDRPVAPQWGGCKTLPPVEGDFGDRIGKWDHESESSRFNNNWKRHRKRKWRRTHLRRNTGELITTLKH